ncbi:MAG: AAA family ATPase [Aurantimonas coralicida]|uniref:AAA family ATPase n=2 Tax=Alphaproteobacteria TaxID=28211 RepID=A0ABY7C033_9HYPH|nr:MULTISPECIES: AAA family ATPase [Aurantimonadaceae]MBC6717579.1 AAA family ATPase [Aurantimonas sp. DM33-3]MCC4299076.1 AAA family ATPase [Aurantimonas coralicida]WAP68389.1 AAA family ATPase [Jiella pelagia]
MTQDAQSAPLSPHDGIGGFQVRLRRNEELSARIVAGDHFPSIEEIASGLPMFRESIREDVRKLAEVLEVRGDTTARFRKLLRLYADTGTERDLDSVVAASEKTLSPLDMIHARIWLYNLTQRWPAAIDDCPAPVRYACERGLARVWLEGLISDFPSTDDRIFDVGRQKARLSQGVTAGVLQAINTLIVGLSIRREHGIVTDASLAPIVSLLKQDGWFERREEQAATPSNLSKLRKSAPDDEGNIGKPRVPKGMPAVIVYDKQTTLSGSTASRDLRKSLDRIAGNPVPIREVIQDVRQMLLDEWPHAGPVINRLIGKMRVGDPIRIRPLLLVGEPGTGKTSLLQAFAAFLELPYVVFGCASSSDNAFGGTPSRWNTASLSMPAELIRQKEIANPLVVLDEIDKAASSPTNGALVDSLLPMLEPHTAAEYFEHGVDGTFNLAHVNFVATANTLSIPAPLKDRFTVIRMPDPGPEHVGSIARRIVEEIAEKRGEEGMIAPLAPDEEDILRQTWKSGSLRKLQRVVETMIDTRERHEVRQ